MVAIALYRGNLHRVPNAPPRRWPIPPRAISVSQFKCLLRRRSLAVSRLAASTSASAPKAEPEIEAQADDSSPKGEIVEKQIVEEKKDEIEEKEEKKEVRDSKDELDAGTTEGTREKLNQPVKEEITNTEAGTTEQEERKTELERKLEELNQRKHNLVQMLKQILNAEEEIKRRSIQSSVPRWPMQGPIENGAGPLRLNVEVNFNNDLVGESDLGSTQSAPTRPFYQMQSPSPSSASLPRSPFVHNQRGQLGHAASLPPLLPLPGNNYMASSPSPAASGGTSVFRDSRFSGGPN